MNPIVSKSASKLCELIRNKELTSVQVAKAFIDRIEEVNPLINAVVQFDPERVLEEAALADKQEPKGLLHGLPITIKDTVSVAGYICTDGTEGYKDNLCDTDATVVKRLKDAGAIILGLTNMPELAMGYETDNVLYGRTVNPHNPDYTPGGSSGGEGALIAAYGSPLGLGNDGGGSIRIPAHFCGIVGIKPTQYSIPNTGLLVPKDGVGLMNQITSFGPLARHVEDLYLALKVLVGPDNRDPHTIDIPLLNPQFVDVSNLKIGYYTSNGIVEPIAEIKDRIIESAELLRSLGAEVEEVSPKGIENTYQNMWQLFFEGGDGGDNLKLFLGLLGTTHLSPQLQKFIAEAEKNRMQSISEYQQAAFMADQTRYDFLASTQKYDILLSPPCATAAKKHGTTLDEVKDFTYSMIYNLLGWPAGVVRAGETTEGLPYGIQVAGKPWREDQVLAVMKWLI